MCFVVVQHTDNDLFYIRQVEENYTITLVLGWKKNKRVFISPVINTE